VLLAIPHHLHVDAVRAALAAGKHVLVEKPLALTAVDGQTLVKQAESAELCLGVAEQYRFSPLVREARRLMDQGELGRVSLVQINAVGLFRPAQKWKTTKVAMGGGVLLDIGVHYVDILRFWFGEPDMIWAARPPQLNAALEGEDAAVAWLRFPGGPMAQLQISWSAYRPPGLPDIEVMGERGALRLRFQKPWLELVAPLPDDHWSTRLRNKLPWRIENLVAKYLPQCRRRRLCVPNADLLGSMALLEDFVDAITLGRAPGVAGADGLADLGTVLAAYQSIQTGTAIGIG
jgi:predicted dehydrogenase